VAVKVNRKIHFTKIKPNKNNSIKFSIQEMNVIKLICKQLTSKEIAGRFKLQTRTIEDYRQGVHQKTGAKNEAGVAMYALINEIIKVDKL
jgi:DNA-binding NarL/FixJ family response regulator